MQTKTKQETVRILIDPILQKYIQKKRKAIPLFGTVEIIKMLLSKGLIAENENTFDEADQILDNREKNNKFLKLSQSQQQDFLDSLN